MSAIYRRLRCMCCHLVADVAFDVHRPLPPLCPRCAGHRDDAARRDRDHAALYRQALDDARDDVEVAHGERDFYRDRSATMSERADRLTGLLGELDDLHHDRGARCSCGASDCRAMQLLSDPAVARLIGRYDERQHTMMALRRANPEAWSSVWDYVDVTLVYPPSDRRATGRHRAAS